MFNIIKSDLYRLVKSKEFYIVIGVVIIMAIVSVISMSAGHIGLSVGSSVDVTDAETLSKISSAKSLGEFRDIMKSFGAFKLDREIIGQNVNLYYMFIVFVVIILTKDFSNKSIKNTLSSAISRKKYYISKLLLILGLSTLLIVFNNYFNYFLNLAVNGKEFSSNIGEITKITIYQLPLLYGIICLLVSIAFITRKTSMFNTISIPFIMVFQLLVMTIASMFRIKAEWFTNYELQYALVNLSNNPTSSYILKCSLLGFVYIVVFGLIGYYAFKKAEIK